MTNATGILTAFRQEGNNCSIFCGTGEFFFLDVLKGITRANLCLASFTDC